MKMFPCAIAVAAGASQVLAQSFHTAGHEITSVSDDGRVAVGNYPDRATFRSSFVWTLEGGIDRFGLDPSIPGANAAGVVSGDGLTKYGGVSGGMYRYTDPRSYLFIPRFGLYRGGPGITDCSFDGSVAVGALGGDLGSPSMAFLWSQAGGYRQLGHTRAGGFRSEAWGISSDGRTVVGESFDGTHDDAFVWTQSGGMRTLDALPGSGNAGARARGISSDGRCVVGGSGLDELACIWRDGVIEALGVLEGDVHSRATSVSDDGRVVVGSSARGPTSRVFVWREGLGMVAMIDYLHEAGVFLPDGYRIVSAQVSADGLTFAGTGLAPGGTTEGFVVTIPAPQTLTFLAGRFLTAPRRRRAPR